MLLATLLGTCGDFEAKGIVNIPTDIRPLPFYIFNDGFKLFFGLNNLPPYFISLNHCLNSLII